MCTEEMGVCLGKFGWSEWVEKRGVASPEKRGPPIGHKITAQKLILRSGSEQEQ